MDTWEDHLEMIAYKKRIEDSLRQKDEPLRYCYACGEQPVIETNTVAQRMEWIVECKNEECPCRPYTSSFISLKQAKEYWNEKKNIYERGRRWQ